MHHIIPSWFDPFELVCYDPEVEDIKKVAFLRFVQLLVFIHDKVLNRMNLYMSLEIGPFLRGSNPIRTYQRGFSLVSFYECTQFMDLYDAQVSKVLIYKFDESFWNIDWTGLMNHSRI